MTKQEAFEKARKRTILIWLVMGFIAPALYIQLGYTFIQSQKVILRSHEGVILYFPYLLAILASADVVIGYCWYHFIPKKYFRKQKMFSVKPKIILNTDNINENFLGAVFNHTIICISFMSACSVYGLVLVLLGFSFYLLPSFVIFTVVGALFIRPNEKNFNRFYKKLEEFIQKT